MKLFKKHWTARYLRDRSFEFLYQKSHPGHPWLTRQANEILETLILSTDAGLEFGSGRSTIWFAKRVKGLISIEHNFDWHRIVSQQIAQMRLDNVDYRYIPKVDASDNKHLIQYTHIFDSIGPNSLDFILVDGIFRESCAIKSLSVLRPGGLLIIDNINWFLPSASISPNSRSFIEGPSNETWKTFSNKTSDWRIVWTSSGVTDTGILFKPCENS